MSMTHCGWYSIVQYIPDLLRREAANIGVLLFVEDYYGQGMPFLETQFIRDTARVEGFFGASVRHEVNNAICNVPSRIEGMATKATLEQFIATRANSVRLTPLLSMPVEEPAMLLAGLYGDLVEDPA